MRHHGLYRTSRRRQAACLTILALVSAWAGTACSLQTSSPPASPQLASRDQGCDQYWGRIRTEAAESLGPGTVSGHVVQLSDRAPVVSAAIILDEGRAGSTHTDSSGAFIITGVAPGPHYVRVRHISYAAVRADFTLVLPGGIVVVAELAPAMFDGPCSGFEVVVPVPARP
jgi:hypothetical protein